MLITRLTEKFGYDTPFFTREILDLFPEYTKAYVFRMISSAKKDGSLARIDTGVYYIPRMTSQGPSVVTGSDVAVKRYIKSGEKVYGIFCGGALRKAFSAVAQEPETMEIVTNNESTRRRKIQICGKQFVLHKSRTEITKDNADAYSVLEFFTEMKDQKACEPVKKSVSEFIRSKKISRNTLVEMSRYFPAKTLRKMILSGVI